MESLEQPSSQSGVPNAWRIAMVNREAKPCAIIRSDGLWGDEFVATNISLPDARVLAWLGIRDHLPRPEDLALDETDRHVLAQDIAANWATREERAVAYQAAAEAIKLVCAAQGIKTGTA
jgi:hypothetical protein